MANARREDVSSKFHRSNQRGFSIVEILVAVSVMSILALGLATMVTSSSGEVKYMETKMEVVQLKNQLNLSMTNETYCGCAFQGHALKTSNPPAMASQPTAFAVSYDPSCSGIGGPPILQSNTRVPSSRVAIGAIRVDNIVAIDATAGTYQGRVVVPFDASLISLPRPIKDIEFPIRINVDPAAAGADKPVTSCTANLNAEPPSVAAFSSDYCYAIPTGKGGGGSCDDGFYVKSVFAYDDDDWQGVGTVCCYGSTGAPPVAQDADLKAAPKNLCVGCSYSEVVTDCNINKSNYGPNAGTACPILPGMSWSAPIQTMACNGAAGCPSSEGIRKWKKVCTGLKCPTPAEIERTEKCWGETTCLPDAP